MKATKLFALTLISGLALTACDPISGTLQVLQPFMAVSGETSRQCNDYEYPCFNQPENITVEPGSYRMKLDMIGRDTAQIRLDIGRSQKVLELKMPSGRSIPDTGHFTLSSHESGQPFDLAADTLTTVSTSGEHRGQESCTEPVTERVCRFEGNPPHQVCRTETRYLEGSQDVAYYYKTTTQDMTAQILVNGATVGQFQGGRSSTDKIYTYKSRCFLFPEYGHGHGPGHGHGGWDDRGRGPRHGGWGR